MSYDQVAGASGGDDASSGGALQGGRGIRRAFWLSHSAFGCAKIHTLCEMIPWFPRVRELSCFLFCLKFPYLKSPYD